jgi:hypothetical protein
MVELAFAESPFARFLNEFLAAGPTVSLGHGPLLGSRLLPQALGGLPMIDPAKNRLHDYEAGWLSMLLEMGMAEERDLLAAQSRVAQKAVEEMNERRERRRAERRRRRRTDEA